VPAEDTSPTACFDQLPGTTVATLGVALALERLLRGFFVLPGRILKPPTSPFSSVCFLCFSRRHGRRRQASVPPLLPLLQPSCVCTECRYVSNASRRPSRAHFPVTTAVVSPSPPEQPPSSRLLARPVGHRPPLPMLRSSSSSPRHPVARPPLQLPPTSISRPEIASLRRPLF